MMAIMTFPPTFLKREYLRILEELSHQKNSVDALQPNLPKSDIIFRI